MNVTLPSGKEINMKKDGVGRVSITPRKPTDRGGFACMPLKKNVPVGHEGWNLTRCPTCGEECWKTPLLKTVLEQGAKAVCTICAIKEASK